MTVGLLVLQLAALVIAADVEVDSDPNKNYEWYPGHYLLLNCTPPSSAELDQSIFGVIRLPRNQVLIATLDGRQELTINCSNDLKLRVTNGKCNDAFCNLHGRCEEMNKGSIHHRFHCICTEKFRGPFCDDEMEGKGQSSSSRSPSSRSPFGVKAARVKSAQALTNTSASSTSSTVPTMCIRNPGRVIDSIFA
ncbi:hypothetical protein L596_014083 [Steinernema carpocapsae]|uniref:EGF-like domain-containing protein n=1 Tax=Steinernema carpocapsae TaxID=34508 RepID=A0A4V6A2T4_STECR|nr:hypothetical protein L596_014083 [Steinernema carpocapsae]